MIVVTGATGHLGRHVVTELLKKVPASQIAVAVRNPEKAKADFDERGVQIRLGDDDKPETFGRALEGATRVLLISSNELGKRVVQHQPVIDAAKAANISLLAYTSILGGDKNKMKLAAPRGQAAWMSRCTRPTAGTWRSTSTPFVSRNVAGC